MSNKTENLASFDSEVNGGEFFGILNVLGNFWTTDVFHNAALADAHLAKFWGQNTDALERCRKTHKFVRVRVRLDQEP